MILTIPGKNKFCLIGQCGGMANITDYFLDFYRGEFLRWALRKQGSKTALKGENRVEKIAP